MDVGCSLTTASRQVELLLLNQEVIMAFTYDIEALDETLNRIRLELGDTDSNRPLLADEEIELMIDAYSNLHRQIAECARLLLAKFSGEADRVVIENFEEHKQDFVTKFAALARYHEAKAFRGPFNTAENVSEKDTNRLDTSIVQSSFRRGMHDN